MIASFIDTDKRVFNYPDEEIDSMLICLICQGILRKPYECKKCQRSFCCDCLEKWKEKSSICPSQCKDSIYVASHLVIRNQLDKLRFYCDNLQCTNILKYSEKVSGEHEAKCLSLNENSLFIVNRNDKVGIYCSYCRSNINSESVVNHESNCEARVNFNLEQMEKCLGCEVMTTHYSLCSFCKGSFCNNATCLDNCNNCDEKFCKKQCLKLCMCQEKLYCDKCSNTFITLTEPCGICYSSQKFVCNQCTIKSKCFYCKTLTCFKCTILCRNCDQYCCSACYWLCNDCNLKQCKCKTHFNAYMFAIVNIVTGAQSFISINDMDKWKPLLRYLYLIFIWLLILPVFLIITIAYIILGAIAFEFLNKICFSCKEYIVKKTTTPIS